MIKRIFGSTWRTRMRAAFSVFGLLALVGVVRTLDAQQAPQTHWEQYKTSGAKPQPDQHLTDPALVGAIDLHAHEDPDSYPRQWDAFEIVKLEKERGMRGLVLKNHWTETAGLAYLARKYATQGIEVFGAVAMDSPVGGLNPQAVRYMADVTGHYGRIVWMPTHDSEHEVKYNKESRPFITVSRNGALVPAVNEVISVIAQHDLTLATGHVSAEEALMILRAAKAAGVKRMIVTHPMLGAQFTLMTVDQMREAANLGAYLEITGMSAAREGEQKQRILAALKSIGAKHFFVSSDAGLLGQPNHTDSLVLAARSLRAAGYSEADLNVMYKENPAFLVNLPVLPASSTR